jgi:hypothetical protein
MLDARKKARCSFPILSLATLVTLGGSQGLAREIDDHVWQDWRPCSNFAASGKTPKR